jgi:hypothetical protein
VRPDDVIFLEAAQQLKETVRQGRSFQTAQVKVIGLDDIRRAAGPDWPRISARVRTNSMHFLEGCLSEGDLVIPAGDGFLVIYAETAERDVIKECATLQDTLNAFYLGEEGMANLRSQVEHKTIEAKEMAAILGAGAAQSAPSAAPQQSPPLGFFPVWSREKEAITGYWAARLFGTDGARRFGYDHSWRDTGRHERSDFLALDLELLTRVVDEAQDCLATNRRCILGYAVHATTMQQRARREIFLQRLHAVEERIRPYLLGRIAEIEPGTPTITIADWVHQIRPVTAKVNLELHMSERAVGRLDSVGAHSVSCVLSEAQSLPEVRARYALLIRQWKPALQRQGLKLRLDNVLDPGLINFALNNEVDFISSERIWPMAAAPAGVRSYAQRMLRNELFAAGRLRTA